MPAIGVIGIGPGPADYLPPAAARMLAEARAVVGGERHLNTFARPGQETFVLKNNMPAAVEFIRSRRDRGVAVLASGDPGLYGVLSYLRRHFPPAALKVFPGISSVQVAFARLAMPWQDAVILSAHGRDLAGMIALIARHHKVALLTDQHSTPSLVARQMAAASLGHRRLYCCCNLGYPDETITTGTADELSGRNADSPANCVLVITDE
ncbi:precorrin-6y C5,15-methyltransferase (decarboxylating) subunit CbiE [Desulfotomaculum copahuensis]|uniref:Precorrin-6y C5,15-methyltransferase (Decarboxylating) subunit CbiE n=1 Tax=Desulfotomaculum copahuensis TaxID=1838280 RepID=A0A1B7LC48_9FIRM|nr:precorrin-6y C5,15-methyltransferase (decarboxylating) subunit CbiE [Desulfotomaculum copahuensis]OAT80271.1 precorrin-6y C5,15-methyltransferase (decarboxylating) subunit CbiE [Desulfotomaculum copahuensis]